MNGIHARQRTFQTAQWALAILAKAKRYAEDAGCDALQFAVELPELQAIGATASDVRWLLARGFAVHAREIAARESTQRRFRLAGGGPLGADSCFVITEEGERTFDAWSSSSSAFAWSGTASSPLDDAPQALDRGDEEFRPPTSATPFFDEARHELSFCGRLIKRYRQPAANQQAILAEFQARNWPVRIRDPLPPCADRCSKRRLNETLRGLNDHRIAPLIRFAGDGTGYGVLWERTATPAVQLF